MLDPDLYNQVAEKFDQYSVRTTFPITECLMEMTQVSQGKDVLDVACGSGIVARRASALVGSRGKVVGIDISPGQLQVAKQKALSTEYHWAHFVVMDASRLDFPDNSFDIVLAQFPHFPNRQQCIAEMFRVLKVGGYFAICNGGGGAPLWSLKNAPFAENIPRGGVLDGMFISCLAQHFPQAIAGSAGNAPFKTGSPQLQRFNLLLQPLEPILRTMLSRFGRTQVMLKHELERAGFEGIRLWSYAYTAPFHKAEEALEWESVRVSAYRMQNKLGSQNVDAFKQAYLRQAQDKLERYGVLGLTTGALFGVGIKPGRVWAHT